MNLRTWLLAATTLGSIALAAGAADWPQWRGPQRDGTSRETGLLKEWPKDGPKLVWQIKDAGDGYATPSVAGGRLYFLSNTGVNDEFVRARAAADGKPVWSTRIGKVGANTSEASYPAARSTPTVDGELLYALGSDGDLACLETATGKPRWQKNIRTAFDGKPGQWAYSESPLVDGDAVICSPGGATATLVALNKKTGDPIWRCAVPGGDEAGYASAIVVEAGGRKQYVQFLGKGLVGVDAKTGQFLWRYDQTGKGPANIPTPVAHDGAVYTTGGNLSPLGALVRLKAGPTGVTAEQVYYERNLPTSIGGSVQVGGFLYGTSNQGLVCAEFATGKVRWRDPCVGAGSVLYADGQLYIHGEKGQVALVEATPEAYREKGRFNPPDQPKHTRGQFPEAAWAYPVLANGRLYIRDLDALWCYDVKDPKAASQ